MEKEIISIIATILDLEETEVELDTVIGDLPEWDSLHHLQIIVALQEKYGIKYLSSDLVELEDVADLIKLTKEYLA